MSSPCRVGGPEFEEAVRMHAPELLRYAYRLCGDRGRAEDVVQDSFARAWTSWSTLQDRSAVRGWLYTIARREHLREFARRRPESGARDPLDADVAFDPRLDLSMDMRAALGALAPSLREPLLMQVLGGMRCSEIAAALATTEGAVMTRLTRARLAMRRLLDGKAGSEQTDA